MQARTTEELKEVGTHLLIPQTFTELPTVHQALGQALWMQQCANAQVAWVHVGLTIYFDRVEVCSANSEAFGESHISLDLFSFKKHVLGIYYLPFTALRLLVWRDKSLPTSKRGRKGKRLHDQAASVTQVAQAFSQAHGRKWQWVLTPGPGKVARKREGGAGGIQEPHGQRKQDGGQHSQELGT